MKGFDTVNDFSSFLSVPSRSTTSAAQNGLTAVAQAYTCTASSTKAHCNVFALVVSGSNPPGSNLRVLESGGNLVFRQEHMQWISCLEQRPSLVFPMGDVFGRARQPWDPCVVWLAPFCSYFAHLRPSYLLSSHWRAARVGLIRGEGCTRAGVLPLFRQG